MILYNGIRTETRGQIYMRNPALTQIARRLAVENAQLQPGEKVCIITDTEAVRLAETFADAISTLDAEPVMVVMIPRIEHGQEVSEIVAAAMENSDLVFQVVSHAITHTQATKRALRGGARVLVLRGLTEDLMLRGAINADYKQIAAQCAQLSLLLNNASQAHVKTDRGTDLLMSLEGRQSSVLDGVLKGPGSFCAMPDGETAISPVEGTSRGILVIEGTMDGIGIVDKPIRMIVENGKVISIEGERSAFQLQNIVQNAGENATNIAEFAIGTNPEARLIGNMAEDKKIAGSAHIALGDNSVLGGVVESTIHLDGLLLNPTVTLDGKTVVDAGSLLPYEDSQ